MKQEKAYNLLSGLVDNELAPDKKLKAIRIIREENWCQQEYHQIGDLKNLLSSYSTQHSLSSNFNINLQAKLQEEQSQETWFSKIMESSMFNKVSYAMATASILFICFVGGKIYFSDSLDQTGSKYIPANQLASHVATPVSNKIPFPTNSFPDMEIRINGAKQILTLSKGKESIKININTGRPYSDLDKKMEPHFASILQDKEFQSFLSNAQNVQRSMKEKMASIKAED